MKSFAALGKNTQIRFARQLANGFDGPAAQAKTVRKNVRKLGENLIGHHYGHVYKLAFGVGGLLKGIVWIC